MKVRVEFKLADAWVGVFVKKKGCFIHIWVCIIPCVPLHLTIDRTRKRAEELAKMIMVAKGTQQG